MVDTVRTQTDLLANLFQDGQAPGEITAQDMRDLIVSLSPSSASARFTSNAVFTVASSGIWTGASSGTSEIINSTSDMDMPQDGRLRYIGKQVRHFTCTVSVSATVSGNNQDLQFRLTVNGVGRDESVTSRTWTTGSDEGSLTLIDGFLLSQNDYIEIEVKNDSSDNDITIVNGAMIVHGHIS